MSKVKKTEVVMIRMVPEEKRAAVELADQLGVSFSDVIRLSLHETLRRTNASFEVFTESSPAEREGMVVNKNIGNEKVKQKHETKRRTK
ncbi:MAG: hypothetical protein C3F13_09600 [Anaerolineales bacterium]|nr:MAG: hypothetical protein C3F13_09600 [Anaerolineales bacterium]